MPFGLTVWTSLGDESERFGNRNVLEDVATTMLSSTHMFDVRPIVRDGILENFGVDSSLLGTALVMLGGTVG